ncbi:MAG TPA: hypothetical protein VM054_00230 [bacterium]|nr:hypothetical protein [bacterium]
MHKVLIYILLVSVSVFAAATVSVQEESPSTSPAVTLWPGYVPPLAGDGAGYYFWDSHESDEWAPTYNWRTPHNPQGWHGDDTYWTVSTPFAIRFCGSDRSTGSNFYIGSNGIMGFSSSGMDDPINQNLPNTAAPNNILAPFWDNLSGYSDGDIWVELAGSAPTRKWCITYSPWYFYEAGADPIEFQVLIYEAPLTTVNNSIEFRYKDVIGDSWRDNGFSATVGLENSGGTDAVQYSYNQDIIPNQIAILFVDMHWVDDQLGEFNLLTPVDGSEYKPGDTVHFTWEEPDYEFGHGAVNYTLYLADNEGFNDPLVFNRGTNPWFDYIFGDDDTGHYWWKVYAEETDIGNSVWCNDVFDFTVPSSVEDTTWGRIKADF